MRKLIRSSSLLIASAALALSAPAQAWGPSGHTLIAEVAFAHLSKKIVQRANAIMRADISVPSVDEHGKPITCVGTTTAALANWADCVRYSSDTAYSRTKGVHFDDIPWCDPTPPKPVYCHGGDCGSEALKHYIDVIRAPGSTPRARAEALAFVVHIVGDLHQPLHTIDNHDAGGNGILVRLAPHVIGSRAGDTKLHSLWDTPMVEAAFAGDSKPPAKALDDLVVQHLNDQRPYSVDNLRNSANTVADAWVAESHAIAVRAYDQLPNPATCGHPSTDRVDVGATYVNAFRQDVKSQLGKAALHLRDVLTAVLS